MATGPTGGPADRAHAAPTVTLGTTPTRALNSSAPSCDPLASAPPLTPLPAPDAMPTNSTMQRIVQRGKLIAAVDQNSYLWGYRDSATGNLEGFDVDLVHQLSQALFGRPDQVVFRTVDLDQRFKALADGTVDIVADSITITCDRKQQVALSTDYFDDGQRVLVRRGSGFNGLADLGGRTVCTVENTTAVPTLQQARPAVKITLVPDVTSCLVLLQLGKADAIVTNEHLLQGLAAQDPDTTIVGPVLTSEPHGLAIAKSDDDFVSFTNAVLEQMRTDGAWQQLYTKWMGRFGPAPQPPTPHYLPGA
ncbi:glutamate ABC transporter substrate-binding protein [Kitasatospora sp. LaBMicrA B282]|uniref:glutamate ABC transporter substrate-binding protein n=1 Tax=Kitasatospora sp. LaBMicrA B282 TaxID=3420949 RepID=UPI003D128732